MKKIEVKYKITRTTATKSLESIDEEVRSILLLLVKAFSYARYGKERT